jgi:hypothetical protein
MTKCIVVAVALALAAGACGDDSPAAPSPTPSTPPPVSTPPTPPPSATPVLTGSWSGRIQFLQDVGDGSRRLAGSAITAELQQDAHTRVTGTWRSVQEGTVEPSFGSLEGTVTGTGDAARFRGQWVHNMPSTTASVRCEASVIVNGTVSGSALSWVAETTMTFDRCLGSLAEITIALTR